MSPQVHELQQRFLRRVQSNTPPTHNLRYKALTPAKLNLAKKLKSLTRGNTLA